MNNQIVRIITAWVLGLIAFVCTASAQQYSFEISVSPSSQKTTAYAWGTKYAPHIAYDIANRSNAPVTISRLWFQRAWTVSDVFVEDGDRLIQATQYDSYTGNVGVSVDIVIPAGATHTVFVRGSIIDRPYHYDEVTMTQIRYQSLEIKGRYDWAAITPADDLLRHHAVIVEQSTVPMIKNSSGLQRLESLKAYGFVITGDRFMKSRVMIRVAGPALAIHGVRDTVSDPTLRIIDGAGKIVGDSNDWASTLAPKFAEVGAFGFVQGSKDSALELELPPGAYNVEVRNLDGAQVGTYLIETYQMSASSANPVIITPPPSVQVFGGKG